MKKIVHNLSFKEASKKILIIDIIINVIEEIRMERKIKMVIQKREMVDDYVLKDITDINMKLLAEDKSMIEKSDFDLDT